MMPDPFASLGLKVVIVVGKQGTVQRRFAEHLPRDKPQVREKDRSTV